MKTPKKCIIYESSPVSFIRMIYIQLDGGHFAFCQHGLHWLQIIKTPS